MSNCVNSIKKLLDLIKVKYTKQYLEDCVMSHPDYPSLLSISDTLEKYKVESLAIKIDGDRLNEIPLPCIVQISDHGNSLFYVLNSVGDDQVSFYDEKNRLKTISRKRFLEIWTGFCLLAESSENSKEPGIEERLIPKRMLKFIGIFFAVFFLVWIVQLFYGAIKEESLGNILYAGLYLVVKIIGLMVGGLLLWYDVDKYNLTLQSFCSGGKKVNCNSVLNSKYATLFNGTLSVSLIGFSYFFGSLAYLIVHAFALSSISLLSFLSFLTLPVVVVSLYYQAVVLKQWCKFCIALQMVLVTEILIGFMGEFHKNEIFPGTLPSLFALFTLPILAWKLIRPLLEGKKEMHIYKRGLQKIKGNPHVLLGLLSKTRKITTDVAEMGISFKNDYAKYDLVKVCNPYCSPCSKAHPILEELVNAGKINLRILFTPKADGDMAKPIRHFLAIDAQGNKEKTQEALDNWYNAEKKDYAHFAKKYPFNGELEPQNAKITAMHTWCVTEEIAHTPTLFINGHELPEEYSIEDLKEVLH